MDFSDFQFNDTYRRSSLNLVIGTAPLAQNPTQHVVIRRDGLNGPVYDAGRNVSWQNLSWSETLPSGSDVELQVAFADSKEGP